MNRAAPAQGKIAPMGWSPLLPEPADDRTRQALLRLFFEHSGFSLAGAAMLVLLHLAYAGSQVHGLLLGAWATAVSAVIALRLAWRRKLLCLDDTTLTQQTTRWHRRAEAGATLTGLLWSGALVMVFDPAQPSTQMYAAMLACVTCVGSINVMAPLPRAFLGLLLPMAATLTALFLGVGSWAGAGDALLVAGGAVLASALLLRHTRLLIDSLAMRFERETLVAQAQAAREAQARFLAAASHDLRQPVHALGLLAAQAHAELEGRRAASTAAQLQAMALALDSLIDALLDVSRLDGGAVTVHPRPMALAPLFDRLAPEFAALAHTRGLQCRMRPSTLWVRSDPQQLERMLRNLLSNALNHTRAGGVLLAARPAGERVRIGVWDTGPGIAPEHQRRIFEEFVQLDNPGRDRRRGHGLGLAIVARLARLLDHPVALRSRLGRGSTFSLSLPGVDASQQTVPLPPVQPAEPLQGRVVALVEDDEAVRQASTDLLRTWGREVWSGAAAASVCDAMRSAGVRPQRIISDWRLGDGSDGVAAIEALRQLANAPVPALLLSGETLPLDDPALQRLQITAARKPLPVAALRAWLSAPVRGA